MDLWTALLPVLTLLLGFFGAAWNEGRRDKRQAEREERAFTRQVERDKLAAASAFERETLLALQDVVERYSGLVGRAYSAAQRQIRRQGVRPEAVSFDAEVSEGAGDAEGQLDRLRARVNSAEVAGWLARMRRSAHEVTMVGLEGRDLAHVEEHMQQFVEAAAQANRAIGDRLRELIYGTALRSGTPAVVEGAAGE